MKPRQSDYGHRGKSTWSFGRTGGTIQIDVGARNFWKYGRLSRVGGGLRLRVGGKEADGEIARGAQAGGGVQNDWDRVDHDGGGGDVAVGAAGNH